MNKHLARYMAKPSRANWTSVLASAVEFDRTTLHCHAPGALVTVGNLVFAVVLRPNRRGTMEKRLRRFNKKQRHFNQSCTTPEHLQRYADQVKNCGHTRWGQQGSQE